MTNSTETKSKLYEESIIIDSCSVSATGWHDRIGASGITALQSSVTWPRDNVEQAILHIQENLAMINAEPRFELVRTVEDIRRCKTEGRVGFILSAQNTDMLGRNASLVEVFHSMGLRAMQFNYNEQNLAADGCLETSNSGLSFFGRELVQTMNEVGVTIDLANTGIKSSLEAIELSSKPCIFAHGNPRATALEQQRNLTDDQIKACASKGGVIGLVVHAPLCATTPGEWPTITDYIRHIEYVAELVGIDHVAIGSDSEATPGGVAPELALQMGEVGRVGRGADNSIGTVSQAMGMSKPRTKPMTYFEMAQALQQDSWGATGVETIEKLPNLADTLIQSGWSDEDTQKLLGGNLLRVYEASWA